MMMNAAVNVADETMSACGCNVIYSFLFFQHSKVVSLCRYGKQYWCLKETVHTNSLRSNLRNRTRGQLFSSPDPYRTHQSWLTSRPFAYRTDAVAKTAARLLDVYSV